MHIYVVKSGDTLFQIARRYGSTSQTMTRQINCQTPISLSSVRLFVIPVSGQFYVVVAGDSLWSISQKYGVTVEELARLNGLSQSVPLQIGRELRIPRAVKTRAEFTGYIQPSASGYSAALLNSAREAAPHLTYFAPVSFNAKAGWHIRRTCVQQLQPVAEQNGVVLMMDITNQENGQFSDELAASY